MLNHTFEETSLTYHIDVSQYLGKTQIEQKRFFSQFCFHHSKNNITIQICIDKSIKTLHDIFDKMSGVSEHFLLNLLEFLILYLYALLELKLGSFVYLFDLLDNDFYCQDSHQLI